MKKRILFSILVTIVFFGNNLVFAQCEPDEINCIDTASPGQICPMILPSGNVGEQYDEVVTIIPPYAFNFGLGEVPVVKIVLTDVENLPEGISYESNAEEFYANNAYCVKISGTPNVIGQFDLTLHIVPTILIAGDEVELGEVVDDTSLTITINPPLNLYNPKNELEKLQIFSNQSGKNIQVKYYSELQEDGILEIIDLQGRKTYQLNISLQAGYNEFSISGNDNSKRILIMRLQTNTSLIRKKFIW